MGRAFSPAIWLEDRRVGIIIYSGDSEDMTDNA